MVRNQVSDGFDFINNNTKFYYHFKKMISDYVRNTKIIYFLFYKIYIF